MSKKETYDKLFDVLLDDAIEELEKEPILDIQEVENIDYSKEHQERMHKIFGKEKKKIYKRKLYKNLQKTAACFLILAFASGVTIASVEGLRVQFKNFILKPHSQGTDIIVNEQNEYSSTFENGYIYMGYIPEGYVLEEQDISEEICIVVFVRETDILTIGIYGQSDVLSIDTENAVVEKMKIDEKNALYSENDNVHILAVYDTELTYTINSSILEKEEIVKIQQNLKIK